VEQATKSITPLINRIAQIPGVSVHTNQTVGYARFHDWYAQNFKNGSPNAIGYNYTAGDVRQLTLAQFCYRCLSQVVAVNGYTASRLIPTSFFADSSLQSNLTELTDFLAALPLGGRGFLVGGGAVSQYPVSSAAVHPAWRKTLINLSIGVGYPDGTPPALVQQAVNTVQSYNDRLIAMTPGSGTYLNEVPYLQGNWMDAFWGSNYPRLKGIKEQWDPQDRLLTVFAVGAEDWDSTVTCRV
jgi:hypothetical protein